MQKHLISTPEALSALAVGQPIAPDSGKIAYDVEIYNGKHLLEVQTVKALNPEAAGEIARNKFFVNINAKIKRHWN